MSASSRAPNPVRRRAHRFLAAALPSAIVLIAAILVPFGDPTATDAITPARFAVCLVAALIGVFLLLGALLLRARAAVFDPMLAGEGLAAWTYEGDEWHWAKHFLSKRDRKKRAEERSSTWLAGAGVVALCVVLALLVSKGDLRSSGLLGGIVAAMLAPAVLLVEADHARRRRRLDAANPPSTPHFAAGLPGLVLLGDEISWGKGSDVRLGRVELVAGDRVLRFTLAEKDYASDWHDRVLEVPVPAGERHSARALVEALSPA